MRRSADSPLLLLRRLRLGLDHLFLLKFFQLRRDHDLAIALIGIVVEILLVLILRLVKFLERHDFCDDGIAEILLRLQLGFLREQLLLFVPI